MSHLESNELIRAEELIEKGKLEEALQLLKDFKKKKDLSLYEQNYFSWDSGRKSAWCSDCKNFYKKLNVSYRSDSFRRYDHPMYETDPRFGH